MVDPIVGRNEELSRVDDALDALTDREGPRLVEICGEAGIGKTRLLDELCERAEGRGYLVLRGAAAEFERNVPFAPVVDALDAYLAQAARLDLPDGELGSELEAIFPSLRTGDAPPGGVQDERYRAYRAVRELLECMAVPRPLVIGIDDLQWADEASVELFSALLQRPPAAPVLVALAGRTGHVLGPLEGTVAAAERRRGALRLALGPLNQHEAEQMLLDRVPEAVRKSVYVTGGGNPFYMEQLARTAGSQAGDGERLELSELQVPAAVSAALAGEIGALPERERTLLQAAAVAGDRFEPDLVAEIAGLEEAVVLDALDDLLDRELVRPTEVPRRFAFRHPLVWRAVYEGAGGGWRLAAHRAAADALAARGASAADRAHHVEHAAHRGDEEAVAVLHEAGQSVAPRTPAAAARWFQAALRLLPEDLSHDETRRSLLLQLASALRGSGDLEACRGALRDAIELVPPDDTATRARLEATCAGVESWLGRAEDARGRLLRARAAVGQIGSPEAVLLDVRLALDALNDRALGRGIELAKQALEIARRRGEPELVVEAASAVSLGHALAGDVAPALEYHAEAVGALEGLPDDVLADRMEVFFYLGWAEVFTEQLEQAVATAERGLALSRSTGQGHLLVPLMLTRCLPLDTLGRLTEAIAAGEEAIEAARTSPNPQYLFWALWECAYSHAMAGNLDRGLALCEESYEASRGLAPNFLFWSQPGSTYGYLLFELGEGQRGLDISLDALGGEEMERISAYERVIAYEQLIGGLVSTGRFEEAAEQLHRMNELVDRLGLPGCRALAAEAKATLLLAVDQPQEARCAAADAWEPTESAGLRFDAAHLLRLEGMALAAMGERDAAIATLRQAEQEFDSFPSIRARDEVRRELRKLGARVEPKSPAPGAETGLESLSTREREVADLVTDRRTNKEVAAALYITEKTVESHLRNIFRKLNVASRAQLARSVERERRG
jgi:DNA-binding CsgD family transcriptional regulator